MQQKPQTASQAPARLRFAPSPTGHLHVGGARTALFNWLLARKLGGTFVLRIEDTDAQRSTDESLRGILDGMRWLGLNWDEGPEIGGPFGPYQQTLRQLLYHAEADRLLRQGSAYRCFCSRDELDAMRDAAAQAGESPVYDGRCRRRDPIESERRADAGESCVIRLQMPDDGDISWTDLVRGELRFRHSVLDDFVLVKSDGNPTYNFAVVVDDVKMRISHVIRGDDHISNTPRQLVLFDALGLPRPEFGHLPMIVGADKTRLSKRHGATSVIQFRDRGILPQAMVNYLALLGWALDGKREIFTPAELVAHFDLRNVSRNPAVFDMQKLEWMNAQHFTRLSLAGKVLALLPRLEAAGLWPPQFRVDLGPARHFRVVTGGHDDKVAATIQPIPEEEWQNGEQSITEELPRLSQIMDALGARLGGPHDAPEVLAYFYGDDFPYDPAAVTKYLASEETAGYLEMLADELETVQPYSPETLEASVRGLAEKLGIKAGVLIHAARVAVTGSAVSPDLFVVLFLVGRAKTVERMRRGRDIIRHNRELPAPTAAKPTSDDAPRPVETPPPAPPGSEPGADIYLASGDFGEDQPPEEA